MICPKCGLNDKSKVIDTRRRNDQYILRRRECVCGHRFGSVEVIELNDKTMKAMERVMKKNSSARAFEKIINNTYRSIFDRYQWLKEKRSDTI